MSTRLLILDPSGSVLLSRPPHHNDGADLRLESCTGKDLRQLGVELT